MTEGFASDSIESDYVEPREDFAKAVPAGLAAAVVGALLWAVAVFMTGIVSGFFAIAVGAIVGFTIRKVGDGTEPRFGVLGGACAAIGWLLGTVLCDLAFVAQAMGRPFLDILTAVGPGQVVTIVTEASDPMDILFLAIAVYEGFKFAIRKE